MSSALSIETSEANATDVGRTNDLYRGKAPIASMDAMEEEVELLGCALGAAAKTPASESVAGLSGLAAGGGAATATPAAVRAAIKYRHLGKSGLKISNFVLGSMRWFCGDHPDQCQDVIRLAYESGVNVFDISDAVSADRAEVELGRAARAGHWPRRSFVVCTKVFWSRNEPRALSRKEIIESVRQSLANLQMDYVDIVVISKYDTNCTMEEVVRAMTFCVDRGLCLYWATSRWSPVEIYEAHSVAKTTSCVPPLAEWAEYHFFHREKVELYLAELYNKIGFGLVTWSPVSYGLANPKAPEDVQKLIARMYLKACKSDKPVDASAALALASSSSLSLDAAPGLSSTNAEAWQRVRQLSALADRLGCSLLQLCLAWAARNQTSQAVVVSAATPEQLQDALAVLTVVPKMSLSFCDELDKVLGNKPSRPPMISTLQQRWAATGGVPPC